MRKTFQDIDGGREGGKEGGEGGSGKTYLQQAQVSFPSC